MSNGAVNVSTVPELIITGASESYGPQLLAFVGALRCNWPYHPPVIVYDLGLSAETLARLKAGDVDVREVPPFVPHWRKHFTWKLWCLHNAPGEKVLWLDAGCCVLRPLPEIFEIIASQGYFAIPNYCSLAEEASEQACEGCGVPPAFREGKTSIAANVFGIARGSTAGGVVAEALRIAHTERYIAATEPQHRHDQALLSLLLYRDVHPFILCDGTIYSSLDLRADFGMHAIWAVRRNMHYEDLKLYAGAITGAASPRIPRPSHKATAWYMALSSTKRKLNALGSKLGLRSGVPDGVRLRQ